MPLYFISGIDTDIGKTRCTGLIARFLIRKGISVQTRKLVQTGSQGDIAEDILIHRKIMQIEPTPEDRNGENCLYRFAYPASPHLAAEMEQQEINLTKLKTFATKDSQNERQTVLLEGAGGFHVPLQKDYLTIDLIEELQCPTIIVTAPRLGSINHTLMAIEILRRRNIFCSGIVYNHFHQTSPPISKDTIEIIKRHLKKNGFPASLVEVPIFDLDHPPEIDFSSLLQRP